MQRTDTHPLASWTDQELRTLINALTRRRMISSGVAAAMVARLDASAQGTPSVDGFREVVDAMGPVLIPEHPQRVIADSNTTLGNMLALGVTPIGTGVNTNSLPFYLEPMMEGVEELTGEDGIDLEKALSLNPDLIICVWGITGNGFLEEQALRYKQVIPTYAYVQNYVYEEDIIANVRQIATALNVEDTGEEVVAAWHTRVAELKTRVQETGFDNKPLTVVRIFQSGEYSIRIGTSESIAFRALGIPQPDGQQNPEDFSISLSQERLDVLNDSWAVIVYIDDNSEVTQEQLLQNEVWQLLTPVQEGRIVFVNSGIWNSIDLLGAHAILDDIEQLILPLAE